MVNDRSAAAQSSLGQLLWVDNGAALVTVNNRP